MVETFNVEEWLNSKKKGISGKVPRSDFIAKMKELVGDIEQLKQEKTQLTEKLSTSQTDLNKRDQIIKDKDKENNSLLENISKLETKTEEQHKTIEELEKEAKNQEELLNNLQTRPNITEQKYQELQINLSDLQSKCDELLNNQEKHRPEELRPKNLPTDWEQQLAEKKTIEENFVAIEEKNLALEKKLSAIEEKFLETEKRPTAEDLKIAVQKETDKYKDYNIIKTELEAVKRKYDELQKEPKENSIAETEFQELNQQLQTEKEKNRVLAEKLSVLPPPIGINEQNIIKRVEEIINSATNPLKQEITELKKQSNNGSPNNSPTELPADYEKLKLEKEELLEILKTLGLKLPE